jgi:DNA-3-methyladenine glycosylase
MSGIDRSALSRPALDVAPLLLGATLRSTIDDEEVVARITEVEAYEGLEDPASHAYRGPTKRNAVMFSDAGLLYCYFVYGMHWCANVTCGPVGVPAAVLLRAAEIIVGEPEARRRSNTTLGSSLLASGPARLARSLGLNGSHTGLDLLDDSSPVRLTSLGSGHEHRNGPRVGVAAAADHPWRFWLPGEPSVSSYRRGGRRRGAGTRQTGRS